MFVDRKDAGEKLARALEPYRDEHVVVLAIPRGGVEVGCEVADYLDSEFSVLISRKLPFPHNPESGFGAVAEDGSIFIFQGATYWLDEGEIDRIVEEQKREVQRRVDALRKGKPLPDIAGKTVILVDDGIAMGSTMMASVMFCKNREAHKIIVATPVAGKEVADELGRQVDEIVILEMPELFRAVAQVYENWYDVSDREVIDILEEWDRRHP